MDSDYQRLFDQAATSADVYLGEAIRRIDARLGEGYARAHPDLVAAFMDVAGLKQYQVVHRTPELILVRYSVETGADPAAVGNSIREVFGSYLDKHGARDAVRVEPEHVERIERDPRTHKIMQVINEVGERCPA